MRVYKHLLMRLSAHRVRFLAPFHRCQSADAWRNVDVMVVVVVVCSEACREGVTD